MNKKFAIYFFTTTFLIFGVFVLTNQAHAQTEVSGNITSDTTWVSANNPYIVTDTVQVLEGATLTIEPGVVIKFNTNTVLNISGKLIAVGENNNNIIFTSNSETPNSNNWQAIVFTDKSIDAIIDNNGNFISGSIIKNSTIEYDIGIYIRNSSPLIANNIIQHNSYALQLVSSNSVISNNLINNNYGTAINIQVSNAEIVDNTIINNVYAIDLLAGGSPKIHNNTIKNNQRGFYIQSQANPKIQYNNIFNNSNKNILMAQNIDVQADHNYWGVAEKSSIDTTIHDYYDNVILGKIIYEPYALTELKFDGTDTFSQPQICTSWTYSNWGNCQSNGIQSRTVNSSSPSGCSGGNPILTQSCTYTPPTCTSFTYSDWSTCANNQQTRTITSSQPANCVGGNPTLNQSCNFTPLCTEDNWISTLTPTNCPSNGQQTRKWAKIGQCQTGVSHSAEETISCNYQAPTCISFVFSDWGACNVSGAQLRSVISSLPSNCVGGSPVLSQSCSYTSAVSSNSVSKSEIKDNPTVSTNNQDYQNDSILIKNDEQEVSQEKTITNSQVTEQRKSEVASTEQKIIQVTQKDSDVGQQVEVITQTQAQNQKKLETSLQKVQSRSGFAKFFVGPNYGEINNTKKLLEQNRLQVEQLNQTKNQLANQEDQQKLAEQIQLFEQTSQEIEKSVNTSQKGFSLFGWVFRLFAK